MNSLGQIDAQIGTSPAEAGAESVCRLAKDGDANAISELLAEGASKGLTIARQPSEIRAHLREFVVAEVRGGVLGCGALQAVCPGLGEIRSIAVAERAAGLGLGRFIMHRLIEGAASGSYPTLVLLTRIPPFFERFGFVRLDSADIPSAFRQKVLLTPGRSFKGRTAMMRRSPEPAE